LFVPTVRFDPVLGLDPVRGPPIEYGCPDLKPLSCRYLYSDVNVIASEILGRETTIPELMKKASLWLERNDFTFEFPRPLMPNMVMIGGMHFEEPNELPEVAIS
jgi:hypothetical protein